MVQALLCSGAYINGCAADTYAWGSMLRGGTHPLPPELCAAFQQGLFEAFADPCPEDLSASQPQECLTIAWEGRWPAEVAQVFAWARVGESAVAGKC